MFYVYVLQSEISGKYYTGHTNDIEVRLKEHNSNLSFSTKNKGPWKLVHQEEFQTRAEAMKREKFLKSGQGRKMVQEMFNNTPR